LLAGIQD